MKVLNAAQEEQIKEIGSYLQQVREHNSVSIEEIAAKTHIRVVLLQALEVGNFEQLPEPIFVQGFIRHYGCALGLDGAALAKSFPTTEPTIEPAPNLTENIKHSQDFAGSSSWSIPAYVPLGLGIVAVVGGLFYIFQHVNLGNGSNSPQNAIATNPQPPAVTTPPPSQLTKPQAPVKVTVELKGNSWMRVVADGQTRFEGTMNKGKKQTWAAKRQLTIRTGNAGVVLASFNQKPAQVLGDVGEIKEVSYKPEKK